MSSKEYKIHSLEEYNKVMKLRDLGLNPTQIHSFLLNSNQEIKYNTLYDWIHYNKKPFQEKKISKIPEESKILNDNKAYILGVLCGDGYIRISKNGYHFLVGLGVCDEDFADEFKKCIENVYNLLPSKKFRIIKPTNYTNSPKPRYIIELTSKLVVKDLLRYSISFKTKEWTVPKEILNSNLIIKSAFLRGIFDSEGTISLRKSSGAYLSVCSGNVKSLLEIKEILKKDFDIDLKTIYPQKDFIRIKSARYNDIKNYYNKIGFTIKRKQITLKKAVNNFKIKSKNNIEI